MKRLSIVVPCFNESSGLALFVDEISRVVRELSNYETEVVFVDDGSTDNSASVIKSLDDTRVKYVFQNNQGVSAARNNGLKLAQGNYIVFFDADDK